MRRVFAVVALVGALFTATACGTKAEPSAAATSAASTAAGKPTKDVCSALEPKVTGWATEIAGLKEITKTSTTAEKEAFFAAFRAATDKLITGLKAASADTADTAFKKALDGLSTYLENSSKTFTLEAAAKGAKNPFEGAEFESAAGEIEKFCP